MKGNISLSSIQRPILSRKNDKIIVWKGNLSQQKAIFFQKSTKGILKGNLRLSSNTVPKEKKTIIVMRGNLRQKSDNFVVDSHEAPKIKSYNHIQRQFKTPK